MSPGTCRSPSLPAQGSKPPTTARTPAYARRSLERTEAQSRDDAQERVVLISRAQRGGVGPRRRAHDRRRSAAAGVAGHRGGEADGRGIRRSGVRRRRGRGRRCACPLAARRSCKPRAAAYSPDHGYRTVSHALYHEGHDHSPGGGAQAHTALAHGRRSPVTARRHRRHRAAERRLHRHRDLRRMAARLRQRAVRGGRVLDARRPADRTAAADGRAQLRRRALPAGGAARRRVHAHRGAVDVVLGRRRGQDRHRDRRPQRPRAPGCSCSTACCPWCSAC